MCVDYTGLNKACPKDPFPLPRIDQVVDSTSGCETLCFLDAYSGYAAYRPSSRLEKCVFEVLRGMLLGFIVFERGIEANTEKILAIMRMGPI